MVPEGSSSDAIEFRLNPAASPQAALVILAYPANRPGKRLKY